MIAVYILLAIICYIFVAFAMHIKKEQLLRFLLLLALFMSVLLMSKVYEPLRTPYLLIFWPYEFGLMVFICDTVDKDNLGLKRIGICALLVLIGGALGAFLQEEPVSMKSIALSLAPAFAGLFLGLIRRILYARLA